MKSIFLVALLILTCNLAVADTDPQLWVPVIVQGPMKHSIRTYVETQLRWGSDMSKLEKAIVRPALWYAFDSRWSGWLGYGWMPNISPKYSGEQRLWEQVQVQDQIGKYAYLVRTRLEQRLLPNIDDAAFRSRTQVRGQLAIDEKQVFWVLLWDEFFFNLNGVSSSIKGGYDQNRSFVGMQIRPGSNLRLEPGFLVNHICKKTADDRTNLVASVSFILNFPEF